MMLVRRSGLAACVLAFAVLLAFLAGTTAPAPARAADMSAVSGTVTVSGGSSLADVQVTLKVITYPTGSRTKASITSYTTAPAPDGRYAFDVVRPADAFYVLEFSGGGSPAVAPLSYRGALRAAVQQDAALEAGGVLNGTATVPAGVDLAGLTVRASSPAQAGTWSAPVNPDGSYRIDGLAPGPYILEFTGPDVPRSYAPGTADPANAATVLVAAGGQTTAPVTTLIKGAFIEGVAGLPAGWSNEEVRVTAHGPDGGPTGEESRPDSSGAYRLGPLWPGTYTVAFQGLGTDGGSNKPLGRLWFPGAPSRDAAEQFTLAAGQVQGGVNTNLDQEGGLSLTVSAPGGTGGQRIPVTFTDAQGRPVTERRVADGAEAKVAAMAASSYVVVVNGGPDAVAGFGTQSVNNGAPVKVLPGQSTALGTIRLTPGTPNAGSPATPRPSATPTVAPSPSPAATTTATHAPTTETPSPESAMPSATPSVAPAGQLPATGTTLLPAAAGLAALLAGAVVVLAIRFRDARRRQRH